MENSKETKLKLLEAEISRKNKILDELLLKRRNTIREHKMLTRKINRVSTDLDKARFTPLFLARDITSTLYLVRGSQKLKKLFIQELIDYLQAWIQSPGRIFDPDIKPGSIVQLLFNTNQSNNSFNIEKEATND